MRRAVISDIHANLEALEIVLADIRAQGITEIFCLGDIIGYGPNPRECIDRVMDACKITLMGNHERGFILDRDGFESTWSWTRTELESPTDRIFRERRWEFLRHLPRSYRIGPYLFVHAGIRPGIPLWQQARQDLMWIREPFLSAKGELGDEPGMVVVHGHTPVRAPVVRPNRIGIDTGAVMGGPLTCVVLEADMLGFLTN